MACAVQWNPATAVSAQFNLPASINSDKISNNNNKSNTLIKEQKADLTVIENQEGKPEKIKPNKVQDKLYIKILRNFNIFENLNKIFIVKAKKNDPLRIFDGIRFLSCCFNHL